MNTNRGFTLLEIAMVTTILGIMAALSVVKYQSTVAHSALDKTANNLYLEIRNMRALAYKYDSWVYGKFSADRCSIYVDTNGNTARDATDIRKVFLIPSPVTIGLPATEPTVWPYPGWTRPTNGMTLNWATQLTVEADSRGDYCHGGIYLKSSRIPKVSYFIGIDTSLQSIELYKWEGTSWQKR
jgi:prepilin-type N-terminal cleavage/methylation domain-containing protein